MIFYNTEKLGLSRKKVEGIIEKGLESNSDVLIGIDDPEVLEMMTVLKEAVTDAVVKNNEKLSEDIESLIKNMIQAR